MKTSDTPSFTKEQVFTRDRISAILGGSTVWFLPTVGGKVVCGCFNRDYNPEAPDIILPGTGPMIERTAEQFCLQDYPIPIFIKQAPKKWEYFGHYQAARFSTAPAEIAAHHAGSITPQRKVTRVIFLKPTAAP